MPDLDQTPPVGGVCADSIDRCTGVASMVYTIGFERRLAGGGAPIRANFSAPAKFCECSKISTTKEIQIMAIGVYFGFTGLDAAKYAECLKRLKKAGAGHPAGRSYHV